MVDSRAPKPLKSDTLALTSGPYVLNPALPKVIVNCRHGLVLLIALMIQSHGTFQYQQGAAIFAAGLLLARPGQK